MHFSTYLSIVDGKIYVDVPVLGLAVSSDDVRLTDPDDPEAPLANPRDFGTVLRVLGERIASGESLLAAVNPSEFKTREAALASMDEASARETGDTEADDTGNPTNLNALIEVVGAALGVGLGTITDAAITAACAYEARSLSEAVGACAEALNHLDESDVKATSLEVAAAIRKVTSLIAAAAAPDADESAEPTTSTLDSDLPDGF